MRLVQITHLFPPESRGGTQSYVEALSRALVAAGHEVEVLTGSPDFSRPGEVGREVEGGLGVHRLFRRAPEEAFSGDLGSKRLRDLVADIVEELDPDLVHLHHWSGLSHDLVRALRRPGRPVVVTLHDLYTTCGRFFRMPDHRSFCSAEVGPADCARCVAPELEGWSPEALEPVISARLDAYGEELAAADRVLTVSEAQRRLLVSLPHFRDPGLSPFPIGVPGGFEPPFAPPRRPAADGPLELVNWGGLDPRKGVHLILEALHRTARPEAFRLHLHGGGGESSYGEELRKLARGLDVVFHGRYGDEALLNFGRDHDLAVFPFLAFETYGLVVDEALRLGLPVVVSDHGAPPERLGGRGLTVPRNDAAALAALLEALSADPERLLALRGAPHRARSFETHLQALVDLYRELGDTEDSPGNRS